MRNISKLYHNCTFQVMSVPHAPTDKVDAWEGEKFKGDKIEGESENTKLKLYFINKIC